MPRNILDYSAAILKTYSINSKIHFAEQAILNHDYKGLKHLIKAINQDWQATEKKLTEQKALLLESEKQQAKNDNLRSFLDKQDNQTITAQLNSTDDVSIIKALHKLELKDSLSNQTQEFFSLQTKETELETLLNSTKITGNSVNYNALYLAIEKLDVEAVKIIMEESNGSIFSGNWNIQPLFGELYSNLALKLIGVQDIEIKKAQILKIGLDFMPKAFVNADVLSALSYVLSKQDFESFYKSKAIDIKAAEFKHLDLKHYELEDSKFALKTVGNNKIIDLLLSHSYSEDISVEKIAAIYQKLYNLHPIAKEMLGYAAHLIAEHNDIKIIFGSDLVSSYNRDTNTILIDSNFQKEDVFNIESVVIHEIGHFVNHQLFDFDYSPFNITSLKSLLAKLAHKYQEYLADPYNFEILSLDGLQKDAADLITNDKFQEFLKIFKIYEDAAREPMNEAAALLKFNVSEYAEYPYTQQYTEYFKDHTAIDLFTVNGGLSIHRNKEVLNNSTKPTKGLDDNIFDNFYRIYTEEEIHCKPANPLKAELSREQITSWGMEEYLPKLVSDLQLNPKDIHFLHRIGDYVQRDKHILKEDTNHRTDSAKVNQKYAELIVRCMEWEAAGIPQASSCKKLNDFHMNYVSPYIKQTILESYQEKLALHLELMGQYNDTETDSISS